MLDGHRLFERDPFFARNTLFGATGAVALHLSFLGVDGLFVG